MALSYGDAYQAEGSYITLIVLNFVIATAMLMTPMMVSSIAGKGLVGMSTAIGAAAVTAMTAAPAKAMTMAKTSRSAIGFMGDSAKSVGVTDGSPRKMMNKKSSHTNR